MDNEIKNLPDFRELGDVVGDGFLWGSNAFNYAVFPAKSSYLSSFGKTNSQKLADNFSKFVADNKVYSKLKSALLDSANYNIKPKDLNSKNYKNYIALAKKLNLNSILINIDWSRIEPTRGVFSDSALRTYKKVIKDAESLGIIPVVVLWDSSHPAWFEEIGAFSNKKNIKLFLNFVDRVLNIISSNTTIITFKNISQQEHLKSIITDKSVKSTVKIYRNIASAHHQASRLIKLKSEFNKVGISVSAATLGSVSNGVRLNNKVTRNILLNEAKRSSDFIAISINSYNDVNRSKKVSLSSNLTELESKKEQYGDLSEGISENQLVAALNHLDKKLQMPILIINNSVSDLEQKFYSRELEISVNAIFKSSLQGASVIGLMYSSLVNCQPIEEGIFTSRSLSLEDSKTGKIRLHPRAQALHKLISRINKVRKPNYQPVVSAIIESMNKYKQSKKNKVKRFLGESAKKISNKVDEVKYKNKLPASNKMLTAPKKTALRLSAGGEGVNPFDIAKKVSIDSINRVKLKSNQVKSRVAGKISLAKPGSISAKGKTTRLVGDFVKSRTPKNSKTATKKPAPTKSRGWKNKKVV